MTLPLPTPVRLAVPQICKGLPEELLVYTANQMRAYGKACAAAERERLANDIDSDWPADTEDERAHRHFVADAIRDEK